VVRGSICLYDCDVVPSMRTARLLVIATVIAQFGLLQNAVADSQTALVTVQDFYKKYLSQDFSKPPDASRPAINLSRNFRKEIRATSVACAKYVEGPCGWGADGDEYLDTQETDPKLNYNNSGISFKEIKPNTVQVKLNVYPSIKDAGHFYDKTIKFKMIMDGGSWVVDDVIYSDGISARKQLADERRNAINHPDTKK
jgi:hypothetical protein